MRTDALATMAPDRLLLWKWWVLIEVICRLLLFYIDQPRDYFFNTTKVLQKFQHQNKTTLVQAAFSLEWLLSWSLRSSNRIRFCVQPNLILTVFSCYSWRPLYRGTLFHCKVMISWQIFVVFKVQWQLDIPRLVHEQTGVKIIIQCSIYSLISIITFRLGEATD